MPGFWTRLFGKLSANHGVSVQNRFAEFLTICQANDDFLAQLARLGEVADSGAPVSMAVVYAGYERLCEAANAMAVSLVRMSGGKYEELVAQCASLEREISVDVLKARPIEASSFVVWPRDPDAEQCQVVGGKAANVSVLFARTGIPIPPFFAITAHAYHHFMGATGLQDIVNEALWSRDLQDARELKRVCAGIREQILAVEMPADLELAIRSAYARLRASQRLGVGVAVRSSAIAEDSDTSFAGQFESVLGVGEEGLVNAYKRVVASKYRHEAIQYARLSGFLDEELAMPVLVMAMVSAIASGVAYSLHPQRAEAMLISSVCGLAEPMVDGRVVPDQHVVAREAPHAVLSRSLAPRACVLTCSESGVVLEEQIALAATTTPAISDDIARLVARIALRLEEYFGVPQDVEWALDHAGTMFVVQSRPIHGGEVEQNRPQSTLSVDGYPMLVTGATTACGGAGCGRVVRITDLEALDDVAEGSVLVVAETSPRLAAVLGRVAAIVAETGSATGHMATVAREFRVPMLVDARDAMTELPDGALVTVDAWSGRVYEGEVPALLEQASRAVVASPRDPVRACLRRLLEHVAPLSLNDPRSEKFAPANCTTLHDIARFVHEKCMTEMFHVDSLSPSEKGTAKRLQWSVPIEVLVLDLGGGVAASDKRFIELGEIESLPFSSLVVGMTDSRLRWAGPVGFDAKGFMSVVVRSAVDDQRYGEPSFAVCSRDYMHFSSRLAYHFATIGAMCSSSANQNYARFVFFGGAAVAERRELRAHFLVTVLKNHSFQVRRTGDRVEAMLGKRPAESIREALIVLGRLMVAARHLDMLMDSQATAEAYAAAFLSGDIEFGFARHGVV